MLRNFLIVTFRNILKRKVFSFINIFGLALGVAACLVILKYVDFETSYDDYHINASSTYRITRTFYQNGELKGVNTVTTYGLGPALLSEIPDVKRYIRTHPMYGGAVLSFFPLNGDAITFREKNMMMVDSTFLKVFTYKALFGDLSTALDNPNSIVITKNVSEKYFGQNIDPIGKTFRMSGGWCSGDYQVSAVIDEVPQNSHLYFNVLVPLHNVLKNNAQYQRDSGWDWNNFITYVELNPNVDAVAVEKKLIALADKYINKRMQESNSRAVLNFQPLRQIHLSPGIMHDSTSAIGMNTIYFFLLIAGFILVIAWINYINLSTARAMERSHEVGIKKAIGVFKIQLIRQFMLESVVINFLGIITALGLAVALLPVLNKMIGKDLVFDFADYRLWIVLFGLFFIGSLISGIYPSFVLSSFKITEVIKGKTKQGGFNLRKALVIFQFASSLILMAGTFGVYRQIMFMRSQDKGLTMDQVLILDGPGIFEKGTGKVKALRLKSSIQQIPGVLSVATSGAIPGGGHNWGADVLKVGEELNQSKSASVVWVDPDFVSTYNIQLLAGKNFDPGIKSDMEGALVNEAALEKLKLGTPEEALNERIILGGDSVAIIGVLKNYNWNSLKSEHVPFILKADTIINRSYSIHLSGVNMPEVIENIGGTFKDIFPGNPFDYYFIDDFFNSQYKDDQQFGNIFGLFAGLAIMISCLGLWGLASFTAVQKLKEIGIRKVLGASTESIISLLSWQFMKLVLIAGLIGLPLAWYGIDSWLSGFAFRIGMQWELFVIPMAMLFLIALTTVSLRIFKGARSNPATILRSE